MTTPRERNGEDFPSKFRMLLSIAVWVQARPSFLPPPPPLPCSILFLSLCCLILTTNYYSTFFLPLFSLFLCHQLNLKLRAAPTAEHSRGGRERSSSKEA